jgi:hypothetical protein
MSFGLKNAGATYQRAFQACFKKYLNKNVKAYVDDVVVKTRNSDTLITDLEETFTSLREYQWKLNPNKCVFGVPSGKLPGFMLTVQNRAQIHRKPTGDLVPFSPRRVLPRFVNPRIGSELLRFSI